MSISTAAHETAMARAVRVTRRTLTVELHDGRMVAVPVAWYPRLANGTPRERQRWELIGPGIGVHWPDLDEDISVEALLRGVPSNESPASLQRWLESRHRPADKRVHSVKARRQRTKRATTRSRHG